MEGDANPTLRDTESIMIPCEGSDSFPAGGMRWHHYSVGPICSMCGWRVETLDPGDLVPYHTRDDVLTRIDRFDV